MRNVKIGTLIFGSFLLKWVGGTYR